MKKIIVGLLAALIVAFGLTPAPASAHRTHHHVYYSDSAKTVLTWSADRGCCHARVGALNVKCHSDNAWHLLLSGENTYARCGGAYPGWIERTWVDPDVFLVVQNLVTGNQTAYTPGCNCSIGGGNYIGWLSHI